MAQNKMRITLDQELLHSFGVRPAGRRRSILQKGVASFAAWGSYEYDQIKDPIEELFIVNIVNFLTNFTFFAATYLSKARYSLFMLKVPLNPDQSISQSKKKYL